MTIRRHNDPLDPHERARALASERLDSALTPDDAAWLDAHLADCHDCRDTAAAFDEAHDLLRSLPEPVPPRDLWARTSAALDRERARGVHTAGLRGPRGPRRVRWEALAGLAAVLLVGLLVTSSILPVNPASSGSPSAAPSVAGGGSTPGPVVAAATPLAVPPGDVAWVARAADGTYAINVASVTAVCPQGGTPSSQCAPLDSSAKQVLSLDSQPGSVVLAPKAGLAAVVERSATTTGGSIVVVPFARPSPTASPSPTPAATSTPSVAPTASPSSTVPASASQAPTASPTPTASPEPGSPAPTPSPTPTPSASPISTDTPAPTAAATLAIINDIVVVGGGAAYSPDGAWLAFSARPANGQGGPDIYVWHVGDPAAHALTVDHGSVFSSWVGQRILGSRVAAPAAEPTPSSSPDASASTTPSASPEATAGPDGSTAPDASASPTEAASGSPEASAAAPTSDSPTSFVLDPTTGTEQALVGFAGWRPVVDPTGHWMAYWTGTLKLDEATLTWLPYQGRLEVVSWVSPDAGETKVASPVTILTDAGGVPIGDFELRWDPTGTILGAWVADPVAPGIGRLSLIAIDPATGQVDPNGLPVLRDAPALPGFSISDGRIAWATQPGQDGEGSRLQVLAWKGPDAGKTTSRPAGPQEDILVVH